LVGYININSIRNKLDGLVSVVGGNLDVLSIAETKLDNSFPTAQFKIKGYRLPFRLDISDKSGGLLVYVKKGVMTRRLENFSLPESIQIIPIELRLESDVWLYISVYRPPKQNLKVFLDQLTELLDYYAHKNCIVIGDFNAKPENADIQNFLCKNMLYNYMQSNTCFKSSEGSCIDLILCNRNHCLQHTSSLNTGLSDHHHMIYTVIKSKYTRLPPKLIRFRSFKNFIESKFVNDLLCQLEATVIVNYELFENIFETVLDRHAPQKYRYIRGNEKPHVNKVLRKAIMKRSTKLKNVYLKSHLSTDWHAYKNQRNFVTNLNKKTKSIYFQSAAENPKRGDHNFWKLCKPFLSGHTADRNKILLVQDGNTISNDADIAGVFNTYFNDITKGLNIKSWISNPSILTIFSDLYQGLF